MTPTQPRTVTGPFPEYFLGLDLGKVNDYTALAILERNNAGPVHRYGVTALMRAQLGTPYPKLVDSAKALVMSEELRPFRQHPPDWRGTKVERSPDPTLVLDATGVGVAVVDMFTTSKIAATLKPLTITSGGQSRRDRWPTTGHTCYYVPKIELVGVVQMLFQTGRLKIAPGLEHAETLKNELRNFEVKVTQSAHETFGAAHREGGHDDLVLAVAMACWVAEYRERPSVLQVFSSPIAGYRGG